MGFSDRGRRIFDPGATRRVRRGLDAAAGVYGDVYRRTPADPTSRVASGVERGERVV